jgi:hypothetical protein
VFTAHDPVAHDPQAAAGTEATSAGSGASATRMRHIAKMVAAVRACDPDAETFEVEAEDELPYVQLGHWIALADIKSASAHLYWFLAMHLNYRRGDRYVWPSTEILAMVLGYSRGDKITPYIRELERLQALTVIKIPDGDGPQKRNVYRLRRTPPPGYAGPTSLDAFYARLGSYYDSAALHAAEAANSTKDAGQPVPPLTGGDVSPQEGGHVSPQLGGVTTRSSNNTNNNKRLSARSASDARRATAGSSARAKNGRSAPSNNTTSSRRSRTPRTTVRMSQDQAAAVRAIEARYPAELAARMPTYRPPALRNAILAALGDAPRQRTAAQLADRLERRWYSWGYAEKNRQGEISSYPGVVIALLTRHVCGYDRCEDGTDVDTGEPCRTCPDREQLRRDRSKAPLPRQHPHGDEPATARWECSGPDCRAPGRGKAPADGLCSSCRSQAHHAAEATQRLAADLAVREGARPPKADEAVVDAAYAEHSAREEAVAEQRRQATAEAARRRADEAETHRLREQLAQDHPELRQFRQSATAPW